MASLEFQLAQINIALPLYPLDAPEIAGFVARLADVNALADASPGFVWRLQTDDGDATAVRGFGDDRIIVNLSVWESIEALHAFVYRSAHVEVMRRRRSWFEQMRMATALWWVPTGHRPDLREAEERLALLREHGPTPRAFTFARHFPRPGVLADAPLRLDPVACPG